ncbi:MAG: DUF1080 domain-containing protein [Ginsengibacter sp.]
MKRVQWVFLSCILFFFTTGFRNLSLHQRDWRPLFNGKDLKGWDTYIGPPMDSAGKKISEIPVGLNNDPNHVFTVVKDRGENMIRISGENWGGISTTLEYENFHLQLKFKWGALSWGQKKGKKKDSGVLYFAVGQHGADNGVWMRSQEFQVQEGDCGDYWGVAGGVEDIPVSKKSDSEYVYNPAGQMITFSATGKNGRRCIKREDSENKSGDWNTLDLYCYGDTSVHVLNGKVMMVLYHSQQSDNGVLRPLKKGKLQIQSEGAEVYYKDIKIRMIDGIDGAMLN